MTDSNKKDDYINIDDFNLTLLKLMENEENQDNDNICLISNETLERDFIKLDCKHTFNYKHIYEEIKKQKLLYNGLEITKLYTNQIKCPHCRHITNNVLPPRNGFQKINGVNWPLKYCLFTKKCCYVFKSGKKKNSICNKKSLNKYCPAHTKIMDNRKKKQKEKEKEKEKEKNKTDNKTTENSISKMTVKQLKLYCKTHKIKKYSTLRKKELLLLINSQINDVGKTLFKKSINITFNNYQNTIITI